MDETEPSGTSDYEGAEPTQSNEAVANALTSKENAAELLPKETAQNLIDFARACFDLSYKAISGRYDYWTEAEQTHDVYVPASIESQSKSKSGRTRPRIIDTIRVPYARAISDTISTYNLAVFGGSRPFRIEPVSGKGSVLGAKIAEAELASNMRRIGYETRLHQLSVDQNRYGMAPTAIYWGQDGNAIVNADPWGYFPDPRVAAQNRDEAEFTGLRTTGSTSAMRRRGLYKNLHALGDSTGRFGWSCNRSGRPDIRGQSVEHVLNPAARKGGAGKTKWSLTNSHVINSLYVWLDPKQFEINAPYGIYRLVIADEKTIILFDQSPFPHHKIPVLHGDGLYDAHKMFSASNYDLMLPLQRFQDWLIRSRVENVQTIVQSRLIVDPSRINIMDILEPNSARLVRTLPGANPREAITPIGVPDATRAYWDDIGMAGDLMQRLTSASDTAQGVQSDTNKTATEITRLTSMGQQRLGTQARLTSAHTIRPMVRMMVQNTQYFGTSGGVVPLPAHLDMAGPDGMFHWRPQDILGEYDYQVTDGTLPTSPERNTENLIRAMRVLSETGLSADWDMAMFVERLIESFGFENVDNWKLNPEKARARAAGIANAATPEVKVVPNETIMRASEAGDLIPMREAMQQFPDAAPGTPQGA